MQDKISVRRELDHGGGGGGAGGPAAAAALGVVVVDNDWRKSGQHREH